MLTKDGIPYANDSIEPSAFLIGHIHWLNKIRKTEKDKDVIRGINLSISILLCSYVEAVLYELLLETIEKRKSETTDSFYLKLLDETINKLSKASWTQYLDVCQSILPTALDKYTDNETWKGISILFYLRNIAVHGKIVDAKLLFKDDKLQLEYSGAYEKAINYFKERKVLKKNNINTRSHKILSTQVTSHFIKLVDKFIHEIFHKIAAEQKLNRAYDFNAYRGNILISHGVNPNVIFRNKHKIKKGKNALPF